MSNYRYKKLVASVAPFLAKCRVHSIFQPFYSGLGHILTLHRVVPEEETQRIHNHLSLEISPRQLEKTIRFYKKEGYDFYSLDQVYEVLCGKRSDKKFVAFTFDDGYLDNYTVAYPILKKYEVPFTIYITTNFPDKKAILWWYALEDMLRKSDRIDFEWEGKNHYYESKTPRQKENAFKEIRQFINQRMALKSSEVLLKTVFRGFQQDLLEYVRKLSMSWEQILGLSQDELCTIGAHTVSHFALKKLSKKDLVYEIAESKVLIEKHIGGTVDHFAYPFGKSGEASYREFEAVKSMGFKTAATTRMGNIFPEHKDHLECLPRISLNSFTEEPVLRLQSSGMLPVLYYKGKRVITH